MINVIGPVNSLGYGITCVNIVKALSRRCEVHLSPIAVHDGYEYDPDIAKALRTPRLNAPTIKIWHADDLSVSFGTRRIGFPIFELDRFIPKERAQIESTDDIFVCSKWAKGIMDKVKPSHVIPLGVDRSIFFDEDPIDRDTTIFMNVGKWETRKGHDILIDIFERAFPNNESVQLWMCCDNPFNNAEEKTFWESRYKRDRVKIFPRVKSQGLLANLIRKSDCGIFPSRAEGWNLDLLEFMSCGKQVITTNYSAHTEYCTEYNSLLVDIHELELANDGKWFKNQGNWGKIGSSQIKGFIDHMRSVYEDKYKNYAGVETAKQFSWDNTANEIMRILEIS